MFRMLTGCRRNAATFGLRIIATIAVSGLATQNGSTRSRMRRSDVSDKVSKEVDPDEIVQKTVNDNGQIYLGRDLGGKTVVVAYEAVDDE